MGSANKFAVMLTPYFGDWPPWVDIYLETCRWNPDIQYLLFTDCGPPTSPLPANVALINMTLAQFSRLYTDRFPSRREIRNPYKICDLRPAFGRMFAEYLDGYRYFGWGDIDVVYGDIVAYLTEDMLRADVISFNRDHVSGHLTFARTSCAGRLTSAFPNWSARVDEVDYQHLDEPAALDGLVLSAVESFNTPLSPLKPWTDDSFVFPKEWYWRHGRLTNDLDGDRSFPYLHFMHWKGGDWARASGNAQWEGLSSVVHIDRSEIANGFKVNDRGFFPLEPS